MEKYAPAPVSHFDMCTTQANKVQEQEMQKQKALQHTIQYVEKKEENHHY